MKNIIIFGRQSGKTELKTEILKKHMEDYSEEKLKADGYIPDAKNFNQPKEEIRRFESGAVRGSGGKFDFPEYLSPYLIFRFAEHMRKSAVKYGAGNFRRRSPDGTTGIPYAEYMNSLTRHFFMLFMEYTEGVKMEPETDHIASMLFNLQGLIIHQEEAKFKNKKEMYGYPFENQNLDKL